MRANQPATSSSQLLCADDPEVKEFDCRLNERTQQVLQNVEKGLSIQSFMEVMASLLEMNKGVMNVILKDKKDVQANKPVSKLVDGYFDISGATLDVCVELNIRINEAKENQMSLQYAIRAAINPLFNEGQLSDKHCLRILDELSKYVNLGSPFSDELMTKFQNLYQKNTQLQKNLQAEIKKLGKKLKLAEGVRRVLTIMYAATCAAVLICAVIAAVVTGPGLAGAVVGVSSMTLEAMRRWLKSLSKKYQREMQERRDLIKEANAKTYTTIKEMDTIKIMIDGLKGTIESMIRNIQFGQEHPDAYGVQLAVEQLRNKQDALLQDLDTLVDHVSQCSKRIHNARAEVLRAL